MISLDRLKKGEEAVVERVCGGSRRLGDLGLVEGTRIQCVLKSPLGDPTAYKVRGAVIAIRKEDAADIFVEACDE